MPLVLLVDQDADTRSMYVEHLRQRPAYDLDEADDGRDALAKAIARNPSVIITELRLPGINGLELCRLLRNDPITRATPIVVVTADARECDIQLAEAAGATTVFVKPCLPERLTAEVDRLLAASADLLDRSHAVRGRAPAELAESAGLTGPAADSRRSRAVLSHMHQRGDTLNPPVPPPTLMCASCMRPLRYVQSHVGGVNARFPEQWDYFECPACRNLLEYRHRTRKLQACSFNLARIHQQR